MTVGCSSLYTPRDARHLRTFNWWLAASMVLFLVATYLLAGQIIGRGAVAYGLTAGTIGLMGMAVRAYVIFLRGADELLRKIQLEALALAFGITGIFMIGWRLCERLGAPKLDVDDPLMVMIVVWAVAQWMAYRRYTTGEEQ